MRNAGIRVFHGGNTLTFASESDRIMQKGPCIKMLARFSLEDG